MIRAVTAALLLLIASPLFAEAMSEAELDALFDKWQAEENRTLEGWRVLDDITLIEKLAPLTIDKGGDLGGPEEAAILMGTLYRHGVGGAPKDFYLSRKYLEYAKLVSGYGYLSILTAADFAISPDGKIDVRQSRYIRMKNESLKDYGSSPAALALPALAYMQNNAGNSDIEKALSNLRLAADKGCLPAKVTYAQHLYRGVILVRDVAKAQTLLSQTAEKNYVPGLVELARFHDYRNGVRPSLAFHRTYLVRAAIMGCSGAAQALNHIPTHALNGLTVDSLFELYLDEWGRLRDEWTEGGDRVLRFEPNPCLERYRSVALWLRPVADPEEGAEYTNQQIARARCMLGECLLHGIGGVDVDWEEAISLLRSAWDLEELSPAGLLSGLYLVGNRSMRMDRDAAELLQDSVEASFMPAERLFAFASLNWERYYFATLGLVELRSNETREAIEDLARRGDSEALAWVAERSDDLSWKRLAAEAGLPGAMLEYAAAIYRGDVEGTDRKHADDLYRRCLGFPETHEAASMHFEYLAAVTSADRSRELIAELQNSLNETGDYKQFLDDNPYAAGVAQRSFEAGYETGPLYALCLLEKHGVSIPRADPEEILLSYPDDPLAVYLIGRSRLGEAREAIWCFEAAANVGAGYASYRLGVIYRAGKLKDKDDVVATEWFVKGAEDGCVVAMLEAAKAYHGGVGVDADAEKAIEWAKKASDAGNEDAQGLLDEWNK